jgi:hypothetical protein
VFYIYLFLEIENSCAIIQTINYLFIQIDFDNFKNWYMTCIKTFFGLSASLPKSKGVNLHSFMLQDHSSVMI